MPDWYAPSRPADIQPKPWLSQNAIAYFESLLRPDMEVLEHGAGGSTLWLAERVKFVTSIENKIEWYVEVVKRIPFNVSLLTKIETLISLPPVDLVFIDGEPVDDRALWLSLAPQLVKPDGYLVLDNANRPEYAAARETMQKFFKHLQTVDGNMNGSKYLVTEFYQKCE